MALMQVALAVLGLLLAGVGRQPDALWVVAAIAIGIALASATQDIAYDAYAVEVLRQEEQGAAVGAKTALYRAAMVVSGGAAITAAAQYGWPAINVLLALVYVPILFLTWKAPEPEVDAPAPRSLREAVWLPFLGFLTRHRALEILAFVLLYKIADQLAQSLTRPFLIDMGYSAYHRGIALATVSVVATIAGAFVGGWVTTLAGLGHSLWVFGILQVFSNFGYFLLSRLPAPNIPFMYGAAGFELFTSGLGTGAFSVLLLRLTQKRFSATQYALYSSLFALPRVLAGPISGFAVDALGWPTFFVSTMVLGIPGLAMLARFVPIGVREPQFTVEDIPRTTAAPAATATLVSARVGCSSRRPQDDARDAPCRLRFWRGAVESISPWWRHRLDSARWHTCLCGDCGAVRRGGHGLATWVRRDGQRGRDAGSASGLTDKLLLELARSSSRSVYWVGCPTD
jgi:MFS transporter, PAT family, beta-lactamase induction signal transducer AmpG